jgi:hypothetical protein
MASMVPGPHMGVLYIFDVVAGAEMTAWRPHVKGIEEVFHARFVDHA